MISDITPLAEDLRMAAETLARDPKEPLAHRLAARALLSAQSAKKQQAALAVFEAYTADLEEELTKLLRDAIAPLDEPDEKEPQLPEPVKDDAKPELVVSEPEAAKTDKLRVTRATKFSAIEAEYQATFERMQPDPMQAGSIAKVHRRVVSGRETYENVEAATAVPWFFVGIVHGLEGGFDFSRHLHNGDPLTARTVRLPKGRPVLGEPPFSWSESAVDALHGHALQRVEDWTLSRILFELERFNGFGYRQRGLTTPYLWSGSDQYRAGKYVRDGVFDAAAVSRQIGGAVVMQAMIAAGDISAPKLATSG